MHGAAEPQQHPLYGPGAEDQPSFEVPRPGDATLELAGCASQVCICVFAKHIVRGCHSEVLSVYLQS